MSILLLSQQEAVVCKRSIQKGSYLCGWQKLKLLQFQQWKSTQLCQELGKSTSKIFHMIKQVYSKEALGRSAVFKGHKRFAQGRDSMEDD
jgi:hypothetical protein